jgi:hypothetical protein
MAEKEEKDKFWIWIGGLIVTVIILVVILKGRETEHLASGSVAESQAEVSAAIAARKAKNKNIAVE